MMKKTKSKMTEQDYRSDPAISRSELWRMHDSPEKFKWFKDHPTPPTPALLFGQVAHKLLLEPDTFDQEFVVAPLVDKRTKIGKEAWQAFLDSVDGRSVVGRDDYDKALAMATKAKSEPLVAALLAGDHEVPFFWTDEDTGERCKCRPDAIRQTDDGYVIADYKTTASAKTEAFVRSFWQHGYHLQAAMYSTGVQTALGLDYRPSFVFIAQEKTEPYAVNVLTVPDDVMLAGYDTFREYLGVYHQCKETDYWYGYSGPFGETNEITIPGWAMTNIESEE